MNFKNNEFLDIESNDFKRIISEMINIKLEDNSTNNKTDIQNLVIYENLINKYQHRKKNHKLTAHFCSHSSRPLTFN